MLPMNMAIGGYFTDYVNHVRSLLIMLNHVGSCWQKKKKILVKESASFIWFPLLLLNSHYHVESWWNPPISRDWKRSPEARGGRCHHPTGRARCLDPGEDSCARSGDGSGSGGWDWNGFQMGLEKCKKVVTMFFQKKHKDSEWFWNGMKLDDKS